MYSHHNTVQFSCVCIGVQPIPTWFNCLNLLKPTGHVMHQQFNIQQLYALPTLY